MTREQVKELLPVIQAFAEGKTVEWRIIGGKHWMEVDEPHWDKCNHYRIKPEPRLRPWKPEEVPVGAQVKANSWANSIRAIITSVNDTFVTVAACYGDDNRVLFSVLAKGYAHSTDNGVSWKACGVMEDAQ